MRQIKNQKGKSAVTFVELLAVIIIIGIFSVLSVPRFKKTLEHFQLQDFSKQVYYLGLYLQAESVNQGKIFYLEADVEKAMLRASYKEEGEFKPVVGRFGKQFRAPEGVSVWLEPRDKTGIYFYPDGSTDKLTLNFKSQNNEKVEISLKGISGSIQIKEGP